MRPHRCLVQFEWWSCSYKSGAGKKLCQNPRRGAQALQQSHHQAFALNIASAASNLSFQRLHSRYAQIVTRMSVSSNMDVRQRSQPYRLSQTPHPCLSSPCQTTCSFSSATTITSNTSCSSPVWDSRQHTLGFLKELTKPVYNCKVGSRFPTAVQCLL